MKMLPFAVFLTIGAAPWATAQQPAVPQDEDPPSNAIDTKQPASQQGTERASITGPEERLLAKLHETNRLEIEFGKLAQKNGQSAEVKQYGKQLEQDHQDADKKVMSIAKEKKLTLDSPAAMNDTDAKKTAEQKAALERLKKMQGAEFDQEFMKVMAEGHDHALKLIRESKSSVRDEKIKSHLDEVEPVLEKHKSMAQDGGHDHSHGQKKSDTSSGAGKSKSTVTEPQPEQQ